MAVSGVKAEMSYNDMVFSNNKQSMWALDSMRSGSWVLRRSSIPNCIVVEVAWKDKIKTNRYLLIQDSKNPQSAQWRKVEDHEELKRLRSRIVNIHDEQGNLIDEYVEVLLMQLYRAGYDSNKHIQALPQLNKADHKRMTISYDYAQLDSKKERKFAKEILRQDREVQKYGFMA